MPLQYDRGALRRHNNPFAPALGAMVGATAGHDCCCGHPPDPQAEYWVLKNCGTNPNLYGFGVGFGLNQMYWDFQTKSCYYLTGARTALPQGRIVTSLDLGGPWTSLFGGCDDALCTGEIAPPPPPTPPPPPDDNRCGECGAEGVCLLCRCTPVNPIWCGIAGTINCDCVGPSGVGPSYRYARIADGWTLNGVHELFPSGPCEWQGFVGLRLWSGTPLDSTCIPIDESAVATLHLKKLTGMTFVFSSYIQAMSGYDPRDYDPGNTIANFRLFSGSAQVQDRTCMTIPGMANELSCRAEHSDGTDGRFALTTGGGVGFDTCPPYAV